MKVAVPVVNDELAQHFGHCEEFAFYEVDAESGDVARMKSSPPPPHQPGVLPEWLKKQGVDVVIAGGMGSRAQGLFEQAGVDVVVGAELADPDIIVQQYVAGELSTGDNICAH
jgi:predicted Fe-Mo cluster-binding NifX family protein